MRSAKKRFISGKVCVFALPVFFLFAAIRLFAETPSRDFHFQEGVKNYLTGNNGAAAAALQKSLETDPGCRQARELINLISAAEVRPVSAGNQAVQTAGHANNDTQAKLIPVEPTAPAVQKTQKTINTAYRNRLEASFSEEYLDPHDTYGSWSKLSLAFYRKQSDSVTFFIQGEGFWRDKDGDGVLGGAGLYKTWNPYLYTYSSFSSGSNAGYLPEIRLDHSFNFKVGPKRSTVIPIGLTYIKSHGDHEDYLVSTGVTAYLPSWIAEYAITRNQSEPGSVESYSHLISVGHGKEGEQWVFLTLSAGKQAYLATELLTPSEVNQNSFYASLRLRRWLRSNFGFTGEVSYFDLKSGYEKYGASFGLFTEF
jgi:YaiO family outer membrane protein